MDVSKSGREAPGVRLLIHSDSALSGQVSPPTRGAALLCGCTQSGRGPVLKAVSARLWPRAKRCGACLVERLPAIASTTEHHGGPGRKQDASQQFCRPRGNTRTQIHAPLSPCTTVPGHNVGDQKRAQQMHSTELESLTHFFAPFAGQYAVCVQDRQQAGRCQGILHERGDHRRACWLQRPWSDRMHTFGEATPRAPAAMTAVDGTLDMPKRALRADP